MPASLIPSFALYCAVSAITPGPANLCSLASAVKYGRRQAMRQWRGIFIGFAIVALASSMAVWFLGAVLNRYLRVLTWIGAGYIFWLAWHILRSDSGTNAEAGVHCSFFTGLIVQLTNPKIMVFCMTALTVYALPLCAQLPGSFARSGYFAVYRSDGKSCLAVCRDCTSVLFQRTAADNQHHYGDPALVLRDQHYSFLNGKVTPV